ncbi:MAG: tetratricopeptide repeat protein [Pyrinomonadaceae bacterium]
MKTEALNLKTLTKQFLVIAFLLSVAATAIAQSPNPQRDSQTSDDDRAEALVAKGLQLDNLGSYVEAVDAFRSAATFSPGDWRIHHNLGVALARLKRYDEAVSALTQAITLMPNSAISRYNLGTVYAELGRNSDALAEFGRTIQIDPHYNDAHRGLCKTNIALNQLQHAVACYENWTRLGSLDADSLGEYGYALKGTKQHEKAITILQKASILSPDNATVLNVLGVAFIDKKQYDQAVAILRRAVELEPDYEMARYNLVVAQIALKNRPAALEQYAFLRQSNSNLAQQVYAIMFRKKLLVIKPE